MTAALTVADRQRLARAGIRPMPTEEALALFDIALTAGEPVLAPVRFDLPALRRAGDPPALLRALVGGRTSQPAGRNWSQASEAEVLRLVLARAGAVLGHTAPDAVQPDQAFADLGFDSLAALDLRNGLDEETGLRLPATVIFDHPTPARLASFVHTRLRDARPDPLLAELDQLKSALDSAAAEADYDAVARRLAAMLAAWTAKRGGSGGSLDEASDDELFSILDDEHRRTEVIRSGEHHEGGE